MLSQAINNAIMALRDPINLVQQLKAEVLLVHDPSPSDVVTKLASQVGQKLAQVANVRTVFGLADIRVPAAGIVHNLCDLDTPVFHKMDESRFQGLQEVMRQASVLLWVTEGAWTGIKPENTIVLG